MITPNLSQCVTGSTHDQVKNLCKQSEHEWLVFTSTTKFIHTLHKSLVEIVVQSVENTTRDIREMQRLLRLLWPLYLNPLLESCKQSLSYGDPLLKEVSKILICGNVESQKCLTETKTKMTGGIE